MSNIVAIHSANRFQYNEINMKDQDFNIRYIEAWPAYISIEGFNSKITYNFTFSSKSL